MTQHTSEAAADGARTPSAIDALAERYVTDLLALHPDTATELGFPGRETEYTDFSPAGARADDELNARLLEDLAALEPQDETDRVTKAAMQERIGLEREIHATGRTELNNIASPAQGIRAVFDLMPTDTAEQWGHIAGRLENLPAALRGYTESLLASRDAGHVAAVRQVDIVVEQARAHGGAGGFFPGLVERAEAADVVDDALAARIRSGWESLLVAGGVESMSRVPMGSDGGAWAMDPATSLATDFIPQGVSADLIATREGFSRAELDRFAAQSHRRAAAAWQEGRFARSVVPVRDMNGMTVLDRDETIRPDSTVETLATLKPSFEALGREAGFDAVALEKYSSLAGIEHLHHPGNSSGIVDGAALTLIGSEEAGRRAGMSPRARIVSAAVVGSEPTIMLTGPTPACRKALEVAGMTAADIDLVEINEAFAAVPLLLMKEMGWTEEQTNVNGGAIAMGHPLGATGAMILGTLVDELERRDLRTGIATLCIGAGMGVATIVERV